MNDDDGTIISDTTSEDSRTFKHTFLIVQTTERPPVIIECKPILSKLKGIFRNKQDFFMDTSLLYDIWCNDHPVKRIKLVDVMDTVAKPIHTTHYQRNIAWETFRNIPGSIFKHQGYLYSRHVHHRRIVHIECDTELQWNLSCTQLRTVHRLLRGRSIQDHPEKLYVDYPTRTYINSIDQFINQHNLHNSEPPSKGKHFYPEGYNCLTRYPSKHNSVRVNQVTGHVQFGDIPVYVSSYEDFLPITDPLVKPPKRN
jgi:hypothetical protein